MLLSILGANILENLLVGKGTFGVDEGSIRSS